MYNTMQVIKIGRNQGNDIVFADQTVSGSHADIYINDDGSLQIVDHSSNGTYVNQTFIHGSSMILSGNEMLTFPGQNCVSVAQIVAHFGVQHPMPQYFQQVNQQSNSQVAPQTQPINVNVSLGNNKGQNNLMEQGGYPKCYNKWCWGGFCFGWLWGVFNRVYWPLIIFIPFIGQIASLIIAIILGLNGNRYAWDKYDGTIERFELKQRRWNIAAFIILGISLLSLIIGIIVFVTAANTFLNAF